MGAALKFIIDGDSSAFEANMKRTERVIQQAAQNAFVFQQKYSNAAALTLDAEGARKAGVEEAARNIKARALRRQRAAREAAQLEAEEVRKGLLLEQNLRDQAAVIEAQREEARRNIRARALRRARAEERAARLADEIGSGYMPDNLRGWAREGGTGRGGRFAGASRALGIGGAASAMFVSVARDSAASLASGASPVTVFLQQAPQVAQAFTYLRSELGKLLVPVSLAGAAITGVVFAVYTAAKGLGALGVKGSGEALGRVLDEQRKSLRARVEALRLEREEAEKILKTRREAAAAGYGDRLDAVGKARMEGRVLEAKTPEEARKIQRDYLKDQMDVAKMDYENKKKDSYNRADPIAQKAADDAELAYFTARNAYLQFNKDGQTDPASRTGGGGKSVNMLTEWERSGGSLGGQNRSLDVSKAQLKELQDLNRHFRTGNGGRGVTY